MKLFISWSKSTSQEIAKVLRDWVPSVLQAVTPYVSSEDIDKGQRWSTEIAAQLSESKYGILCVTKENISEPWINFEGGALSKALEHSFVCPLLIDIKRSDVQGPLVQFQSALFEKDDVLKLMKSLNTRLEDSERISVDRLERTFDKWWPDLEKQVQDLLRAQSTGQTAEKKANTPQIIEEILELSRHQVRLLSDQNRFVPRAVYVEEIEKLKAQVIVAEERLQHRAASHSRINLVRDDTQVILSLIEELVLYGDLPTSGRMFEIVGKIQTAARRIFSNVQTQRLNMHQDVRRSRDERIIE